MNEKKKGRGAFHQSKPVLVFNGAHTLISIVSSVRGASQFSGIKGQAISYACNGKYKSAGNYFFRHLDDRVEMEIEDIGTLQLEEYDRLCSVERAYHSTREMARRRNHSRSQKEPKK